MWRNYSLKLLPIFQGSAAFWYDLTSIGYREQRSIHGGTKNDLWFFFHCLLILNEWNKCTFFQVVLYLRDLNGFWISGCIHLIISRNFPAALQAVMLSPCLPQICYIIFEKSTFEHVWYQPKFFSNLFRRRHCKWHIMDLYFLQWIFLTSRNRFSYWLSSWDL